MKYGIFYNKQFDALMIAFNDEQPNQIIQSEDNITILKNKNNQIVGINIFNVSNVLKIKTGFVSEEPEVYLWVQDKIKKYLIIDQEPQFVIGRVLTSESIPNTHLHLTTVEVGLDKPLQIVCGAKNIRKDLLVVVALIGAWMPNSLHIVEGKIKGFDSFGMIVSAKELGIKPGIYNDFGIIELPENYSKKIGKTFWKEIYKNHAKI